MELSRHGTGCGVYQETKGTRAKSQLSRRHEYVINASTLLECTCFCQGVMNGYLSLPLISFPSFRHPQISRPSYRGSRRTSHSLFPPLSRRSPAPILHASPQRILLPPRPRTFLGSLRPITLQPIQPFPLFLFLLSLLGITLVGVFTLDFGWGGRGFGLGGSRGGRGGFSAGRRGGLKVGVRVGQERESVERRGRRCCKSGGGNQRQ
jgi:hypothetical protein